jgi:uncharacterized membrane protein YdjX (TVP38/TMEM64 family)
VSTQPSLARKRFRQFLLSVALVHVVAIAGYYALGVERAPTRFQRMYAWTWMGVTVAVVVIGLQRLKRARARTVIRRPAGSEAKPDGG